MGSRVGFLEEILFQVSLVMTNRTFCNDGRHSISVLSNMVATSDMCLLRIWNVARMTQELTLQCYSILINFNLSSHMWLFATILDSMDLDPRIFQTKKEQ